MRIIHKKEGETPLEALENYRRIHPELQNLAMTYAGRLDPLASGKLIILIGDECKDKEKYLGLDKEYIVEILFGFSTDTYDVMGLPQRILTNTLESKVEEKISWSEYCGRFIQEYPPYSSKSHDGKQLHELSRRGKLPETLPSKEVEIYSIQELAKSYINAQELLRAIRDKIVRVKGDFRQDQILAAWDRILAESGIRYLITKIKVKCSAGTYMRSLANRVGLDLHTGAVAFSIERTEVFQ